MKKILLLGFGKIAYMPYMNFYLDTIENAEFELIYWDRDGKPDAPVPEKIAKAYKFESHLEEQLPFKKKLKHFYAYRKFALKVLKRKKYDRIIVLHTTPGLTLLDYLARKYKKRYLLDFRDISYEYIPVYRKLVGVLATNAAMTVVSSNAFRKFLPDHLPIYTIHNYLSDSLKHQNVRCNETRDRECIRIAYWGLVRQVDVNVKLMDALGNDPRFELHYYGRMQQDGRDMQQYAQSKEYKNVFFHGSYMPEDRYAFAAQTDMIHNVYDLGVTMGNAMGNKYYDSLIFRIPQICTAGSHMGDEVIKQRVGLTVDLGADGIADIIWQYYQEINWLEFQKCCEETLNTVIGEQSETKRKLTAFIND